MQLSHCKINYHMKIIHCITLYISLTFFLSPSMFANSTKPQEEIQNNDGTVQIDLLPMYGSTPEYGNWQKTEEELEADRAFLEDSDQIQPDRKLACQDYIKLGWVFLEGQDWETAMRRANQAWQLDDQNADVYTLFAAILNFHQAHDESLDMLERAITITPDNINLYDIYLSESIDLQKLNGEETGILHLINMLNKLRPNDEGSKQRIATLKKKAIEALK